MRSLKFCLLALTMAFFCGAAAAQETVKVGVPGRGLSFLPAEFGVMKGFYQEEGINLSLTRVAADVSFPALVSGELDFALTVVEGMRANIRGLVPVKMVGGMINAPEWFIYGQADIKDLTGLKGKAIGAGSPKGEMSLVASFALRKAGVDAEKREVHLLSIPDTPARIAALQGGKIAAAAIASPGHLRAKKLGFKELASLGELIALPVVAWSTTEKKLKENPAQIKKVLRAALRSVQYILRNRDEVADFVAKNYGLDKEDALAAVIVEEKFYSADGEIPEEGIRLALQLLRESGEITHTNYPFSRFADFSLLREVKKGLGR